MDAITSGYSFGSSYVHLRKIELSGTSTGASTVTASPIRTRNSRGVSLGKETVLLSYPMPIICGSFLYGDLEVTKPASCPTASLFRMGQLLQRGDISTLVMGCCGLAIDPYSISYTLYQISPGPDGWIPVDPILRYPVRGADIGEYYIVGHAGEGGQPGRWGIEWKWQVFFEGPINTMYAEFNVLPGDTDTDACNRTGWF